MSSNVSGQAYALTSIAPIGTGRVDELRAYLEALPRDPSPLTAVKRTHFARWVILDDFCQEEDQPHTDHLDQSHLIFTSNFDGPLDSYLDELIAELGELAGEIWGRCTGCSEQASAAELKAYLLAHQIDTGFFFAAYGQATVDRVRTALDLRQRLIAFAVESQGMEPAELQSAFLSRFPN